MQGSRRKNATYRYLPVGHIQMQFITYPSFMIPFAVLLAAHIAWSRQIIQHLLQRHPGLALDSRRLRRQRLLTALRPAPLADWLDQTSATGLCKGFSRPSISVESRDM